MLDFKKLFESAFKVKEFDSGRVFLAVQATEPFESPCPDNFETVPVERVVEDVIKVLDPASQTMVKKAVQRTEPGTEKRFDEEHGHFRGGNIRGRKGDYILTDGASFFVVREKDDSGVRVFDKRFVKL